MKNRLLLFFVLIPLLSFAQNNLITKVYLKNNDLIRGYLIEDPSSDTLLIKSLSLDTLKIAYTSIHKLYFGERKQTEELQFYNINLKNANYPKRKQHPHQKFQSPFFRDISIGLGAGVHYGGIGFRFQQRFVNQFGFAWHIGAGYTKYRIESYSYDTPNNYYDFNYYDKILLNIGFKFIISKWFYLGTSLTTAPPNSLDISGHLFFMVGADYYFSKHWGFDLGFGVCAHNDFDYWIYGSRFSFNASVFYKIFNPYKKQQP